MEENKIETGLDNEDLIIQDEQKPKEAPNKMEELLNIDFSADVDLKKFDELIEFDKKVVNKDEAKNKEADFIINELAPKYLDEDYKKGFDKMEQQMWDFFKKYDVNKNKELETLPEEEKNLIYVVGKTLNKNLALQLNKMLFNFDLTPKEYKFIFVALKQKMSYDGNEIFNIKKIKETYLDYWEELSKAKQSIVSKIDIESIVMLYHFLGKHVIKGLGEEYYTFISILTKIADINKVFNAYNIKKERITTNFLTWTGSITPLNDAEMNEAKQMVKTKEPS